mmetsp:Transcript_24419/g.61801  ORF Transcript_24419/g.61801 Transcript_24419/m.61801 type:complete len:423 (-) Transcript_24419:1836-3104(-)
MDPAVPDKTQEVRRPRRADLRLGVLQRVLHNPRHHPVQDAALALLRGPLPRPRPLLRGLLRVLGLVLVRRWQPELAQQRGRGVPASTRHARNRLAHAQLELLDPLQLGRRKELVEARRDHRFRPARHAQAAERVRRRVVHLALLFLAAKNVPEAGHDARDRHPTLFAALAFLIHGPLGHRQRTVEAHQPNGPAGARGDLDPPGVPHGRVQPLHHRGPHRVVEVPRSRRNQVPKGQEAALALLDRGALVLVQRQHPGDDARGLVARHVERNVAEHRGDQLPRLLTVAKQERLEPLQLAAVLAGDNVAPRAEEVNQCHEARLCQGRVVDAPLGAGAEAAGQRVFNQGVKPGGSLGPLTPPGCRKVDGPGDLPFVEGRMGQAVPAERDHGRLDGRRKGAAGGEHGGRGQVGQHGDECGVPLLVLF